jgi:Flp pilus assembly protein TadD
VIAIDKQRKFLVCLALALGTALLYLPALHFGFVNYDDPVYVMDNPHIRSLSWQTLDWAFQPGYASLWHPLTWMSHALDCHLYGLDQPGGHHATSVLLHILSAILLFLVLDRMTNALWRSAVVAALFAWHPLHVESVAWISERKDVLSALFWMLTIWAYVRYVEELKIPNPRSKIFYFLALLFFALGLMSKPMLVTLPFVLLLLDWWPLRRMQTERAVVNERISESVSEESQLTDSLTHTSLAAPANPQSSESRPAIASPVILRLLIEKLPFLFLSIIACVMTLKAAGHLVQSSGPIPLTTRLTNALLTYFRYIEKTIWPTRMVAVYPLELRWSPAEVLLAGLTILVITVTAVRLWKARPFWLTGWLLYLGIMVPVVGLVWVDAPPMADHYTYLSSIGLFIIICWEGWDIAAGWRYGRAIAGTAAAVALAACCAVSHHQLLYWSDSATLYLHTIHVMPNNTGAHADYAAYLRDIKDLEDARKECDIALHLSPNYAFAHDVLGGILLKQGDYVQADSELRTALRLDPRRADVHLPLGMVALARNQPLEAQAQFTAMLATDRFNLRAYIGLAAAYDQAGDDDKAIATARQAHNLAVSLGDTNVEAESLQLLELYGSHQINHQ